MCGCELHWNLNGHCTCACPEHASARTHFCGDACRPRHTYGPGCEHGPSLVLAGHCATCTCVERVS